MKLLYFSPVYWSSYPQRPHYVARYFLERFGQELLWVDPYPNRLPKPSDFMRSRFHHDQGTPMITGLSVVAPRAFPIEPLPLGACLNHLLLWRSLEERISAFLQDPAAIIGIGRPNALALLVLRANKSRRSFYDAMDNFPYFYQGLSRIMMGARERAIAGLASQIFVSSDALGKKFDKHRRKTTPLHNAYAMETLPPPLDESSSNIIGYIGTISSWFDWEFVLALAGQFPNLKVHLVGPCFNSPDLRNVPNVIMFPPCDAEGVKAHLATFKVGLIPFRPNVLTDAVDPIKYYEYRAMGLPVVSTMFQGMSSKSADPGVFLCDKTTVTAVLPRAMRHRDDVHFIWAFREKNSWHYRFEKAGLFTRD